jgi:hypothetical protein
MNYPVFTNLLYASNDLLIYTLELMALTDDSFAVLSKELSANIQFDSNPILVLVKLSK